MTTIFITISLHQSISETFSTTAHYYMPVNANRFDFTKLLPDEWELLGDDEFKVLFERNYTEQLTRIAQPKIPNFKAIDYFILIFFKIFIRPLNKRNQRYIRIYL